MGKQQGSVGLLHRSGAGDRAPFSSCPQSLAITEEIWESQEGTVALPGHLLWARKGLGALQLGINTPISQLGKLNFGEVGEI